MRLSGEALRVMSECISRREHLTIETVGPAVETGEWCGICKAPSMAVLSLRGISADAVYDLGTVNACALHEGQTDE